MRDGDDKNEKTIKVKLDKISFGSLFLFDENLLRCEVLLLLVFLLFLVFSEQLTKRAKDASLPMFTQKIFRFTKGILYGNFSSSFAAFSFRIIWDLLALGKLFNKTFLISVQFTVFH